MCVCVCVCALTRVRVCAYIFVCMCVCVCVCVCISVGGWMGLCVHFTQYMQALNCFSVVYSLQNNHSPHLMAIMSAGPHGVIVVFSL